MTRFPAGPCSAFRRKLTRNASDGLITAPSRNWQLTHNRRPTRSWLARAAVAGRDGRLAACGGMGSAGAGTFLGGTYAQSIAYTKCMRSHGVPQWEATG